MAVTPGLSAESVATGLGAGTSINVNVSLPEREAHRRDGQHQVIEESPRRLTSLAAAAS
jgi:hypothetical protein